MMLINIKANVRRVILITFTVLFSTFLFSCATIDNRSEPYDVNELAKEFAIAKLKTNHDNKRAFILLTERNPLLKNPPLLIKTNNANEKQCVFNQINNISLETYTSQAKVYLKSNMKSAKSDLLLLKKLDGKTSIDEIRKKLFTISATADMSKSQDTNQSYFSAFNKLMYDDKYAELLTYVVKSPSPNFFDEKMIQQITDACVRID